MVRRHRRLSAQGPRLAALNRSLNFYSGGTAEHANQHAKEAKECFRERWVGSRMTGFGARCCQVASRWANGKLCQKLPFRTHPAKDPPLRRINRRLLGELRGTVHKKPLASAQGYLMNI